MAENKMYGIDHVHEQTELPERQRESRDLPPSYITPPNQYCPMDITPAGSGYHHLNNPVGMTSSTTVVMAPLNTMEIPPSTRQLYLILAALANLCCCSIFGIIGIFYAGKADADCDNNNYESAHQNLNHSKKWTMAACLTGFSIMIICIIIVVVIVVIGSNAAEENNGYNYNN